MIKKSGRFVSRNVGGRRERGGGDHARARRSRPASSSSQETRAPSRRKNNLKEQPPDVYVALQERIASLEASVKKQAKPSKKSIQLSGSPTSAARQLCEHLQIPQAPVARAPRQPRAPREQVAPPPSPADAFLETIHRAREERRQQRGNLYASFLPM